MIAPSRSNIEGHRRTFLILNFHRLLQHQHQLKVKCINKNRCNQGCENLQCQSSLGSFHAIRIIQTKSSSKPGTDVYNGKNVDVSVSLLGLILHSCCKTNFWNQILQARYLSLPPLIRYIMLGLTACTPCYSHCLFYLLLAH